MENELPVAAPFTGASHLERSPTSETQVKSEDRSTAPADQNWLQLRVYGISIAGFNFLAQQGLYCEVLTSFKTSSLPNTPEHFLGLTNVRGNLVPVYQLEPLLAKQAPSALSAPENEQPSSSESKKKAVDDIRTSAKPTMALMFGQPSRGAALVIHEKPKPMNIARMLPVQQANYDALPVFIKHAVKKSYSEKEAVWHQIDHLALFGHLAQEA